MPVELREHVKRLSRDFGGLRQLSKRVGLSAGYLSRISHGLKDEPSDATLIKLGLRRVVTYERLSDGQ